jgi:hypothetical protein
MYKSIFAILLAFAYSTSVWAWPDWVTQHQQDSEYLVGVGVGDSRSAARQSAIADIVTQLSVDYRVEQTQILTKRQGKADSQFTQVSQLKSLPFTLEGIEELEFFQQDAEFALLLGIKKSQLIKSLQTDLAILQHITSPTGDVERQFMWALQQSETFLLSTKKLSVLTLLAGEQPKIKQRLEQLLTQQKQALQAVSCDVIGNSHYSLIKSALNTALPHSGKTRLWMRPNLKWKFATKGKLALAKARLTLKLMRSRPPFSVLIQHDIEAQAKGSSREVAKAKAIEKLLGQLSAPASVWMFDT